MHGSTDIVSSASTSTVCSLIQHIDSTMKIDKAALIYADMQ